MEIGYLMVPRQHPDRPYGAAGIDNISGGRFDLGVGIGSAPPEFEGYNVPREEAWARSWEAIDFIERCFREEEPLSHKGTYFQFDNVHLTTKPLQKPLPIWWGGRGPKSVERAAERGYPLLNFSPHHGGG